MAFLCLKSVRTFWENILNNLIPLLSLIVCYTYILILYTFGYMCVCVVSTWMTNCYPAHRKSKSHKCSSFILSVCALCAYSNDGLCDCIDAKTHFIKGFEEFCKNSLLLQEMYNVLLIWCKMLWLVCRVL